MSVPSVTPALEAIGADWLTTVLRDSGHSEVSVGRVDAEPLGAKGGSSEILLCPQRSRYGTSTPD
jgi:hypothetical protein